MTHRTETGPGWTLVLADWREVELPQVDIVCEDPPYGKRTHAGQKHGRVAETGGELVSDVGLQYDHLEHCDVLHLVAAADAVCKGWGLWKTSHDLIPSFEAAAAECGRYHFAPVPIVQPGMNVRLAGDGPSNWTVHLVVTRTALRKCWGTKPGAYIVGKDYEIGKVAANSVKGGKPLGLLEAILRDYTDAGDLVLDRFAGGGTTGVAAIRNGRRFFGCESKPEHFEIALKRLRSIREQRSLFETMPETR